MNVEASTATIRPYCVCAVLRGVQFDKRRYKSFIDLQDKLHQNICRRRTYVAIGTHDLDTIQGPFKYQALPPTDINFVPLTENHGKSYNGKELLDFYREDPSAKHLKPYTDIIYDSPVYPVITDANNTVLSLPPIINSKHSRIQLHTTNVFIECTGTDITKANIVLDTVVAMFSEYCEVPFSYEEVEVNYEVPNTAPVTPTCPNGDKQITPLMSHRLCETKVSDINGTIGVNLSPDEICKLCDKMQLGPATYDGGKDTVTVHVPPTRSDILHPVDVIEDVAIAYGYNNIVQEIPATLTVGGPLPINQFTDLIRQEVARAGYMEMLTHGLCSIAENFTNLRRPVGPAVSLSNPANVEYEVVRTTLVPGALKTLAHNRSISHKDGVRLFEISDVVLPCDNEVGAKNVRKFIGLHAAHSSAFEVVHGLADRVFRCAQILPEKGYAQSSVTAEEYASMQRVSRAGWSYSMQPTVDPLYFPGMGAEIILKKVTADGSEIELSVGSMGVVHPDVLAKFELQYPCSVVEIDMEAIMD
jgi:phenylalanyl-tRNA synthetase beta chain